MFEKQLSLLQKEYEYERAEFRREAETQGVRRRIRKGNAWYPLKIGRTYYNALNRFVVEIERTEQLDVEHNFEYGKSIVFFGINDAEMLHFLDFTASVAYVEGQKMVCVLPNEMSLSQLQSIERLGVTLHFDETTYRLMFEALRHVEHANGNRVAELRDLFYRHSRRPSFSAVSTVPTHLPWLNAAQQQAVQQVVRAKDVLVVHGPPGTGKTTTLVEAIDEVLRRETQIMVCAQSNTAVDWIAQQLQNRSIQVLRVGNPTRVTDDMLACTYERRFEAHLDYPQLWQIRRSLRQLYAQPRKERGEKFHQKVVRLKERADEIEIRIKTAIFNQCRVVASTLAGAAHPILQGFRVHTLFIDEAAQALEAACWIAIPHADRVVLAGDHCQLPPTVKCPEALKGGLAKTLMEKLVEQYPEAVHLLTTQYRMNESLMRFSSDWFYEGRLQADASVRHRNLLDDLDFPMTWIDTSSLEQTVAEHREGQSVANPIEAELTLFALRNLAARFTRHRILEERIDFAIISPYKAQVQLLRKLLKTDDYLHPLRHCISINTVDAFQGQERDVVVISMVRSNDAGTIGFLSDLRRMNVAITRARSKLILLGSCATLCKHRFYRALFEHCQVIG